MTKPVIWDEDMRETLRILVSRGSSIKEIATVLEVPINSVKYFVKENNIAVTRESKTLSDEELIQRLKEHGPCTQLTFKGTPGFSTYKTRFGSWTNAVKLAGWGTKPRSYTDKELLEILSNSSNPTYNHFIQSNDLPSAVTYRNRFGSWANALELAGIVQNPNSLIPSKNTIVYLLEFEGFFKVGITQQGIEERFLGYPKYEVILTLNCTLDEARKIEKEWLKAVRPYSFYGVRFPRNNGATECFKT